MQQIICTDRNIVYVDFESGWRQDAVESLADLGLHNTYLEICAATLDESDYYDLLEAIQNPEFYGTCDTELQELADGYFEQV